MASEEQYLGLSSDLYTHVPTKCSHGHTTMPHVAMHLHTKIITVWPLKTSVCVTESALSPHCNKFWSKQE